MGKPEQIMMMEGRLTHLLPHVGSHGHVRIVQSVDEVGSRLGVPQHRAQHQVHAGDVRDVPDAPAKTPTLK